MFTEYEQRELPKILDLTPDPEERLTLVGLHGFMYALVITPEVIMPSEWLPVLFGDQMPKFEDAAQADRVFQDLAAFYNRLNGMRLKGELVFPFDYSKLEDTEEDVLKVHNWAFGFWLGLSLSPDIWPVDDLDDAEADEDDPLMAGVSIVTGIAFPHEAGELFNQKGTLSEDELIEMIHTMFGMLPKAVHWLQGCAEEMEEGSTYNGIVVGPTFVRTEAKTDRNAPCPCGSGKKYKRCCGLN